MRSTAAASPSTSPGASSAAPEENLDDPHWADRGFFWEGECPGVDHPVRYPGAPYRFTRSPVRLRRRPPLLGEHNHEVYVGELGLTTRRTPRPPRNGRRLAPDPSSPPAEAGGERERMR